MGFNRSALVAGLVLTYLGIKGEDAVALLREKRPGALFNENFAAYLTALPPNTTAPGLS
jgi:protein-tyrosine phosphatase